MTSSTHAATLVGNARIIVQFLGHVNTITLLTNSRRYDSGPRALCSTWAKSGARRVGSRETLEAWRYVGALAYLGLGTGLRQAEPHARWVFLWTHLFSLLGGGMAAAWTALASSTGGLIFFVQLMAEVMGAMAWGVLRRLRSPFFIGLAANAINVPAQLLLAFAGGTLLIRTLIIGGMGLVAVTVGVLVERQRERHALYRLMPACDANGLVPT